MNDTPTAVDLFCGGGGFSHGFEQAGFTVEYGVDSEGRFKETFETNHTGLFIEHDLSESLPSPILDSDPTVVIGGPPCQGFSLAGKRESDDERNQLVTQFVVAIRELQPEWFVMENVPQILSMEDGAIKEYLLHQFETIGYDTQIKKLDATDFGVPQTRQRAFFIGRRAEDGGGKIAIEPAQNQTVSVREALSDLPPLQAGEQEDWYSHTPDCAYQSYCRSEGSGLTNHKAPNHGSQTIDRFKQTEPGEKVPYDSWSQKRRLLWDEPAPTLMGGPRPTYHFVHPDPVQHRGLTVRERARIQSFPDSFEFIGPVTKQRQMTGNAVPVRLSKDIADRLFDRIEPKNETQGGSGQGSTA